MRELSIFVDESGDFGPYMHYSPYYIVTLVFHEQSKDISENINRLNDKINLVGFSERPIHTGPLIRKESDYRDFSLQERKRKMLSKSELLFFKSERALYKSYLKALSNKRYN